MPCGGIYPTKHSVFAGMEGRCFHCHKEGAKHFCEEWDCLLHARCVPDFLKTMEGKIVIEHGHEVLIDFSLEK